MKKLIFLSLSLLLNFYTVQADGSCCKENPETKSELKKDIKVEDAGIVTEIEYDENDPDAIEMDVFNDMSEEQILEVLTQLSQELDLTDLGDSDQNSIELDKIDKTELQKFLDNLKNVIENGSDSQK